MVVAATLSPGPAEARVSGSAIVRYAERFLGVPYEFGGDGPDVFDCSGFTAFVYRHFGIELPRTSYTQLDVGVRVRGRLRSGDLLFWAGGSHVGIYTGHDAFISATVHRGIAIYPLRVWRQTQHYDGGRRLLHARRPVARRPAPKTKPTTGSGGAAPATGSVSRPAPTSATGGAAPEL